MRIFITGGAGFVGSHLAEAELAAGHNITVLDLSDEKIKHLLNHPRLKFIRGSILDEPLINKLIERADLVYHLAAIADPHLYCNNPLKVLEVDLEGSQLIMKLAHRHLKKLVFSSTSEIYGKNPKVPWKENDDRLLGATEKMRWSYSSIKSVCEHYLFAYAQKGLKMTICRFFNFYGPRLDFLGQGRVISCFLERFLTGKPVQIVKPGNQTRCFTFISDGIDGLRKAAHLPKAEGQVFNLGTNRETTMIQLAQLIKRLGGFKSKIVFIPAEKKYGKGYDDIPRRVPNIQKAKKILRWEPTTSLEDGLKQTIEYYRMFYQKNRHES